MANDKTADRGFRRDARVFGIVLLTVCVVFFGLLSYGGIRSSDSEVVFRLGESIGLRGTLYLERDLEDWHAFGVAAGGGVYLYSIFGPLESFLLAPIIKVGDLINETEWYRPAAPIIPLSFFTEGGFYNYVQRQPTKQPRPHALRFLASFFNVVITALGVFVFWKILLLLTGSIPASFLTSLVYAFGTHAWVYAGTFFSEPLATLLILLSFLYLLKADRVDPSVGGMPAYKPVFWSGIWMGLAVTAHITAALYAPFFTIYFFWKSHGDRTGVLQRLERASVFAFGVFILLFLLGLYNYVRFSSFFETGRTMSAISGEIFGYGSFVLPLKGLFGLWFGAGKGIVFFMPVLVVGVLLWKNFYQEHHKLFWIVAAAVAFRVLFIAARSDWHAGFCIGPRYLVMAIPFFLIPLAMWLKRNEATGFNRAFGITTLAALVFSIEQLAFALSEIFTFLQILKFRERYMGIDVFVNDVLYLDWRYSPLLNFGDMRISPFFLRFTGLTFGELVQVGTLVLVAAFAIFFFLMQGYHRRHSPSLRPEGM